MAKQMTKSALTAKLGAAGRKAFDSHKSDETRLSAGGNLPAGIENGIAQLVMCKFGTYEQGDIKGEPYFMASAVVKLPTEVNGVPVQGLRTQIGPEPLCDTPTRSRKTVDEHIDWVLNEFRKLGVDTKELSFDDWEATAAALQEEQPHIRFRTWSGGRQDIKQVNGKWVLVDEKGVQKAGPYKSEAAAKAANPYAGQEPRVQHQWGGICEFNGEVGGGVTDETGDDPNVASAEAEAEGSAPWDADDLDALAEAASNGDVEAQEKLTGQAKLCNVNADEIGTWEEVAELIKAYDASAGETTEDGSESEVDLDALGAAADEGDEDAQGKLNELGAACDPALDGDDYPTWVEYAEAIKEAGVEYGTAAQGSDGPTPAKGEVWFYKNPKTKKKVECEVMAVFEDKRTCNLKSCVDGKTLFKNISFDEMEA